MYIHVKVQVGAKEEKFEQTKDLHFTASVREKAERNLANKRILELVGGHFGIDPKMVKIVSGHHSPSKLLSVRE